jgi:NADPH:quinone reductase-like Zn-dependent oxidoreductase
MFAVYCETPNLNGPLAALIIGNRPEPNIPEWWGRVKVTQASLNRRDIFTLHGMTAHEEGISFPMILGNDAVSTLEDGTPVVIYPVLGSDDWRGDETIDPHWHILSEFVTHLRERRK